MNQMQLAFAKAMGDKPESGAKSPPPSDEQRCQDCFGSGKITFRNTEGDWDTDVCLNCDGGKR